VDVGHSRRNSSPETYNIICRCLLRVFFWILRGDSGREEDAAI